MYLLAAWGACYWLLCGWGVFCFYEICEHIRVAVIEAKFSCVRGLDEQETAIFPSLRAEVPVIYKLPPHIHISKLYAGEGGEGAVVGIVVGWKLSWLAEELVVAEFAPLTLAVARPEERRTDKLLVLF